MYFNMYTHTCLLARACYLIPQFCSDCAEKILLTAAVAVAVILSVFQTTYLFPHAASATLSDELQADATRQAG